MLDGKFDIQSMRVASPCSIGWDTMTGDDRVRHCNSCNLNIYNTAEMTTKEIEALVLNPEGRLCIRLYRRADGTVLTRDCPVGLRAVQKRIARSASACLATILSFVSFPYGQEKELKTITPSSVISARNQNGTSDAYVLGTVMDPNGAVIAGAKVELYEPRDPRKKVKYKPVRVITTDSEGTFAFRNLSDGTYEVDVQSPGFKRMSFRNVKTIFGAPAQIKVNLEVNGDSVVVGIFLDSEPLIDMSKSGITTVIRGRKID
jgi:hypothetical protein